MYLKLPLVINVTLKNLDTSHRHLIKSIMARRKIELAKQFFTETTIHGCRYTVDRQFHICENIIWIFVTIFFFHIGAFLVYVSIVFKRWLMHSFKYFLLINIEFILTYSFLKKNTKVSKSETKNFKIWKGPYWNQ